MCEANNSNGRWRGWGYVTASTGWNVVRITRTHTDALLPLQVACCSCMRCTDVAREILQRQNADVTGHGGMDSWHACGHHANYIIALPPRRKWRAMRKLRTEELFTPRRLGELRAVREEAARELASSRVCPTPTPGARQWLWRARCSWRWRACCGGACSPGTWTPQQLRDVVEEAVVVARAPNLSDYFPVIAAADVLGVHRRMEKLVGWVYGVIDLQIDQQRQWRHIAGEPRKNGLLDVRAGSKSYSHQCFSLQIHRK
uniref:Uncharacterized protein n=1 Tax=Oryza meridionalis TaxID=40149 RepID=A0A0E0E1B9_9ORYZ